MNYITIVLKILAGMSPEFKAEFSKKLDEMTEKAKQTKNPLDDIAVGLLRILTGL